ncbi:ABC transporter permease [Mycobacterium lehmannii]|uniref:ABC transporter permease n=1 Tax=Mycobacterium lehmannii TaxID=2048550 RepID=UPI000B93C797|nr:ABC transporter permease [Mycobacterium lehmannii]
MPPAEPHGSLLIETWLHAGRILTRLRRDRFVLMGSLLLPISFLTLYEVVLGARVQQLTGESSVYGLVPICAILSGLFGSLGNAASVALDRESGLLSRIWVLPIHRASPLLGRVLAEAVRALVGTLLIVLLGMPLGLRFANGALAALIFLLIPAAVVVGFTSLVLALAIRRNARTLMAWLISVTIALAFINPGFSPIETFPPWIQPFVRMQPMSPPVETMRALASGGPIAWSLTMTLLWTILLLAAFTPIAVRGFRAAAEASA